MTGDRMQNTTGLQRRAWLKAGLALAALPVWLLARKVEAAAWFTQAFEAKQTSQVMAALKATAVPVSPDLQIDAPQKAENGAVVQIELTSKQAAGSVSSLRLPAETVRIAGFSALRPGGKVLAGVVRPLAVAAPGDRRAGRKYPATATQSHRV